jgi:hypothetical protein
MGRRVAREVEGTVQSLAQQVRAPSKGPSKILSILPLLVLLQAV